MGWAHLWKTKDSNWFVYCVVLSHEGLTNSTITVVEVH